MKKFIKKEQLNTLKENKALKKALILAGVVLVGWGAYVSMRPGVGVIDFNAVQTKAKAYQSVLAQQQKYEDEIRKRMSADSVGLEKDIKDLKAQEGKLKKDEYIKKSKALQKRWILIQSKYRPDAERIVLSSQIALKSIEKEIASAVEATAKKTGVKVLLPMNNVLYAKKCVDVTDKFVQILDKKVETVAYPDPSKLAQ